MGIEREFARAALGLAIALAAVHSNAAPQSEPLVVTQLADPDPNYVPLPAVSASIKEVAGQRRPDPTLDEAMQDFGRAIGQAGMLEQQQVDARCKSINTSQVPMEQRYVWEANCRYRRH
jgi:hypothetical protein